MYWLYCLCFKGKEGNFKIIYLVLELYSNVFVLRLFIFKDLRLYFVYDNLVFGI